MKTRLIRRAVWALLLVIAVAAATWFARPRPVPVDMAVVARGVIEVTVDDEAKTRVRHVYTVSAPTAGKVLRISNPTAAHGSSLHVGDDVVANETVVAVMQPVLPAFLDYRSREELQAMLAAAEAAVTLADSEVRRIDAALEFSRSELRRAETLARTDTVSVRALEKARLDVRTNEAALASAKAQLEVRRSERTAVAARLIDPANVSVASPANCCIRLRAPVTGRVLRIIQENETVVSAGFPLVDIGDPTDLEIAADLLSSDAVRVSEGASVRIDGWGGRPLAGRVTRIDPVGFMKISALGIEEQRVRTIIDFTDPPADWARLGHDFRVNVHVTVSRSENALTVPVSALFRKGDAWAVFAVRDGRAKTSLVQLGARNSRAAEVLQGLTEGDRVVLHPSDRVTEGVRIGEREIR